ncbi:hypothetical protein DPMN_159713 [Dreissena polymorpha]|uniref:Uncharacterized protein n=1 Tax=Dreissena polymorpha TaxID=45954 RepID=A0A9D4IQY2_DREPO|nr:hypothetical protein DPMN_159709 [Dreissena polymorpha]KAH3781804.1 hypothetical protein DPMN_159711 [Dreissena polymorpha]KAH3781806.1 hypothetical protein DPMN_159713 [Dreissena polymorpha]
MQAVHLRLIDNTMFVNYCWGMLFHSRIKAGRNWLRFLGAGRWVLKRLPNSSQTCSMGDMSSDSDGQFTAAIPLVARKALVSRAECAGVLSCWNNHPLRLRCINGETTGAYTVSMYRLAVTLPWRMTRSVL